MNKDPRKSGDPVVRNEANSKPAALFGKNAPPEERLVSSGEHRKSVAPDGLAEHQRNPLAPPITITANS